MKKALKNNAKLLIGLIAGILVVTTTVYAEIKMASSDVLYDNTTSGLTKTNAQDAIDELKAKVNNCKSISGL